MCLGIPAKIVAIADEARMMAVADISGIRREVSVICVAGEEGPGALVGKWVVIHVGFAMSVIDEEEAAQSLATLAAMGEAEEARLALEAARRAVGEAGG